MNEVKCSPGSGERGWAELRRPAGLNVLALGLCRAQQKCISDGVSTGALEFTPFPHSLIHPFPSSTD